MPVQLRFEISLLFFSAGWFDWRNLPHRYEIQASEAGTHVDLIFRIVVSGEFFHDNSAHAKLFELSED
jgi:hypothetical protein